MKGFNALTQASRYERIYTISSQRDSSLGGIKSMRIIQTLFSTDRSSSHRNLSSWCFRNTLIPSIRTPLTNKANHCNTDREINKTRCASVFPRKRNSFVQQLYWCAVRGYSCFRSVVSCQTSCGGGGLCLRNTGPDSHWKKSSYIINICIRLHYVPCNSRENISLHSHPWQHLLMFYEWDGVGLRRRTWTAVYWL